MDDHYNGLADNSRKIWAVYTFLDGTMSTSVSSRALNKMGELYL